MKKSETTPRIIEISKEIAKYWKMKIYEGCWVWFELSGGNAYLGHCMDEFREHQGVMQVYLTELKTFVYQNPVDVISIPSLSDALEKLKTTVSGAEMVRVVETVHYYCVGFGTNIAELYEAVLEALLMALKEANDEQ